MRAFWKLIAAAILAIAGVAVADAPLASAYLSTCRTSYHNGAGNASGTAWCQTYGAPGGYNQVRARVNCGNSQTGGVGIIYGPWVTGTYAYSHGFCPAQYDIVPAVYVETR